jgi:hypothetical protein
MAASSLIGASLPTVVAHGRAFIPPHLLGRGVTLLNLFGIAPVGIAQVVTGRLHAVTPPDPASALHQAVFLFFAGIIAFGLILYHWSKNRTAGSQGRIRFSLGPSSAMRSPSPIGGGDEGEPRWATRSSSRVPRATWAAKC